MLPAARVNDLYLSIPPLFIPGIISGPGALKVTIGGMPAAVMGTPCMWLFIIPDVIVQGSAKVMIEGRPAARLGHLTTLGGAIFFPNPKVFIGG